MDLATQQWLSERVSFPVSAHPRRALADGVAVAQVLAGAFPAEFSAAAFSRGASTAARRDNWAQILRFLIRKQQAGGGGGGGGRFRG